MKRTFLSAAAILAFAASAHADELIDIQTQAKQLREQNQALTKRLADLEKRQKALETQTAARPAVATVNPVDSMAADLPYKAAVKAKAPENDDLCWHGVCLYGNFDLGVSYMNHGAPFSALAGAPLNYLASKNDNGAVFAAGVNQLSTSFIGLRGKQEIADQLYAVFNLQTLFNSADGGNVNGVGSVAQNNGLNQTSTLGLQNSFGDSSKAGVMFNNVAYFGVSSPTYGTFTMGRQSALSSDLVVNYDSLSGSNAWSLLTFQGANGGGGATEDRIYDNSYEYRVNIGPVRLAAEVQLRNGGNSGTGNAFEGNIGFDYMGLSMDFVGGKIFDAVSAAPLSAAQAGMFFNTASAVPNIGNTPQGLGPLSITVSDNTVFQVGAKYVIGPWKFYGGYENIHSANPSSPLAPGAFLQGGFIGAFVNNANFTDPRTLQTAWFGAKYAITPTLDVAGAYYHEWQNAFVPSGANVGCTDARSAQCSGQLDAVSLVVDWRFARHMDMYAGVMWSQLANGLANNGFLTQGAPGTFNVNNKFSKYDPGIGLRYQF